MKSEKLLNAIGGIDAKLIAEAEDNRTAARSVLPTLVRWIAASIIVVFCTGMFAQYLWYNTTVGTFTMDINPSVEYCVSRSGTVKSVNYINRDAEELLRDIDFADMTVEKAVFVTVDACKQKGYINDSDNVVLVSFDYRINNNARLEKMLTSAIKRSLIDSSGIKTVVFHNTKEDVSTNAVATKYSISKGKAQCILEASENTGMPVEELVLLPLDEILELHEETEQTPIQPRYIGIKKAKQIAIEDAGCKNKVTIIKEALIDGGIKTPYYHLVFKNKQTEWTYRIDAVLGSILEKDKKHIGAIEYITLEKAKEIALTDAGLINADLKIVFTKEELNKNQGRPCYILEFYTHKYEHSYKIDAKNGKILFRQRYLLLEEAKRMALEDAGCSDKVTFLEEILVDGGIKTPYYRLVFADTETKWTYRIDAVLCIILEKEKESIGHHEFISLEKAKEIALKDAGLDAVYQKIVFTKEALYRNQGNTCYILEFYTGQYQYRYMIGAVDGSVIEKGKYILLSDAKALALKDAGCTEKVTFSEETLVDGGIKTPYYFLVFADSQTRWTYRIDAVLCIILEKQKEPIFSLTQFVF